MSSVFLGGLNPERLYSLYEILYPKRKIESYSLLGTIVSPNKMLLTCTCSLLGLLGYEGFRKHIVYHIGIIFPDSLPQRVQVPDDQIITQTYTIIGGR